MADEHTESSAAPSTTQADIPIGIIRRLGIMIYDYFLVFALLFLATAIAVKVNHNQQISAENLYFKFYLLFICCGFYVGFWLRAGQTLGMKAWKTRIVDFNNQPLSLYRALLRFTFAIPSILCLGIGLFWQLFDKDNLALHDRLSGTKLVCRQ